MFELAVMVKVLFLGGFGHVFPIYFCGQMTSHGFDSHALPSFEFGRVSFGFAASWTPRKSYCLKL